MKTMKAPVISRLVTTARGMLRKGLRASPPSAVALSKPTREKTVITMARERSCSVMPETFSWAGSLVNPCLNRITNARARMHTTETASKTRVRTEETRMSL